MIRGGRGIRPVLALIVAAAALLLTGCVYLRLLALKHQFEAFDQNFTVDTANGVKITCRNPVLLRDDIRWLGLSPQQTRTVGKAEQWQVRWVKQLPPTVREAGEFDIVVGMLFVDDKLTNVAIPERYFAVMPKQLLVDLLRSLGSAKVDRDRRAIEAQLTAARPDLPGIEKLLGKPTGESSTPAQSTMRYRYVPVDSKGLATKATFNLTLVFDRPTGELLRWQANTPVGNIGFNFAPSSAATKP